MYSLRNYQAKAVEAVYAHLRERDTNPCVVIPTAGGKSICIAQVAKDAVERWGGRVMVLAHVKELVEQNAAKLKSICPELPVGIYSAGLKRRDTKEPVVVAGIQSVYDKIGLFEPFDLVMVDEVHMVPSEGEGRYRTFLRAAQRVNPNVRLVGWTATPFRTQGGLICKPGNLFEDVCYEVSVRDLIRDGYVSKIRAKAGRARANLDNLHIRGGEFVPDEVEEAMGEDGVVRTACREIAEMTKDRKACLVFCTSVEHCRRVASLIAENTGEECAVVTGETPPAVRAETIARLRGEKVVVDLFGNVAPPLRYCCNVGVMTTGTDIPALDTIALLRPTASPGLLIQMIGRGFRLSPQTGKTECLVLDYGRNLERFGPIDTIRVKDGCGRDGEPKAKECPRCLTIVAPGEKMCPECGYEWPSPEPKEPKLDPHAAGDPVISTHVKERSENVVRTEYAVWTKRGALPGAPRTVRVRYYVDMIHSYSEWVCPEHTGYARGKFEKWWRERAVPGTGCPMPRTAEDVVEFANMRMLRPVKSIRVRTVSGEPYPEITGFALGDAEIGDDAGGTDGESKEDSDESAYDDLPF